MPASTADKALASGGSQARAFWKGSSRSRIFMGIGIKFGSNVLKLRRRTERGGSRWNIGGKGGARELQFEFEDLGLVLLMGKFEVRIRIMMAEPKVEAL